ncbi:MAG: xanthine dehydrogenase family protein molybdopterin-binding subunit [Bacteroidetes bacterium]|nr:xanthine dehydrogenase family protein molybdopterin-binding subunit [Bacteroidota bacterium]MBU2585205.1 xanthine dehydrogenase family protein molybdopterin-binding subunit [Bacteroidota bacterium]
MKVQFNTVGKPVVRQDAYAKVIGEAKFADDHKFAGMLYGVMVRVSTTHAIIKSIDYSAIENNPTLVTICDSNDIPGEKIAGLVKKDQPIFSFEKIVTPGDVIAILVGESAEALYPLTKKIKIEYDNLPILSDPLKALDKEAPLIHPGFGTNLIVHYPLRKGNIEKGFEESEFILEEIYTTPNVEHAYIEPECVIAIPLEADKGVHIIGSIQNPFTARRIVAQTLNLPLNKVRIEQAELGGSFGGKDDTMCVLSARAAVAALKTKRPIKIRYTREESILESYKRHPYVMKYKVGYNRDGKIKSIKIDITADGGAYASLSPFVTWRSVVQATGPYEVENVWTDVRAVYTNNPYTGAMRGFGSPQIIFAQESIMDEIAIKLGMTPDEIRGINGYRAGSITSSGQKLENHDVNFLTVLGTAIDKTNFREKWLNNKKQNEIKVPTHRLDRNLKSQELLLERDDFIEPSQLLRKGIGLAVSFRGCSLGAEGIDAAAAYLSVQLDGSAYLLCGLTENGQGMKTTLSIIVSEILGIPVDRIYYLEQDTALISDSGPTVASRSTLMGGSAVKNAAEIIRERLENLLYLKWNLPASEKIIFENNFVYAETFPDKKMSISELCSLAYSQAINLAALGWYPGPKVHWNEEHGQGPAYFTYVYGCQVAEVTVNLGTGEVYIDKITAVHDPGRVINMLGAKGQVYGGVTQGAGYGLWEEIDKIDGKIRELNFDQYIIPTSKDIGEIDPIFIEGKDNYGPWGAKSLGEPTLELTAAAINNAIRNAVGERFRNLPINLEEVLLRRKLRPEDLKRGSA